MVNVEFAPSTAAYNKFASKLCKTLEGVCKMKGEFTSVIPKVSDKRGRGGGTGASNGQYFYVDGGNFQGTAAKWMPELWKAESGHWRWQSKGFAIAIATLVSADSSRIRWNYYVLDEAISHGLLRATSREAACKLSFLDASDQVVSIDDFVPQNNQFPRGGPNDWEVANSWRCFLRVFYDFKPHQYGIEPGRFASDDQSETNFAFVAPLFFGLAAEDVYIVSVLRPEFYAAQGREAFAGRIAEGCQGQVRA